MTHQHKTSSEKNAGKREIARNEQFFLFSQRFLLNQIIASPLVHIFHNMSFFAAEFEEPTTGMSGKGLKSSSASRADIGALSPSGYVLSRGSSVDSMMDLRTGGRWFEPLAQPIFLPRINDSHCDMIHSPLTAILCFDDGYVGKQPVA